MYIQVYIIIIGKFMEFLLSFRRIVTVVMLLGCSQNAPLKSGHRCRQESSNKLLICITFVVLCELSPSGLILTCKGRLSAERLHLSTFCFV